MIKSAAITLALVLAIAAIAAAAAWMLLIRMPGPSFRGTAPALTPSQLTLRARLHRDVATLAVHHRNPLDEAYYAAAAQYIGDSFERDGYRVTRQEFEVEHHRCANVEVEITGKTKPKEIVVIGAHYDSVDIVPGADDNASGVAALLALASAFAAEHPARTLRFVAFANEEPPYFQTESMGSLVYARRCRARGENVVAMLSLESIGYFRDEEGSQRYPPGVGRVYPTRGNFLAFVGNIGSRSLVRRTCATFRASATIPAEGGALPNALPGVGWSDQWSFWQCGYRAVMVTDTAIFRNPNYHTMFDTPDTLDYDRFTRGVDGLVAVIRDLVNS
jgi:hypothetical protein